MMSSLTGNRAVSSARRTRSIAQIGCLSALAVGLGYVLSPVPNVELVTVTCFLSGYLFGWGKGMSVGLLSMTIYSILNPRGMALPPVTVAQVSGMAIAGLCGALVRELGGTSRWTSAVLFAVSGLLVTSIYDLLTNVALGITLGNLWSIVVAGMAFSVLHIVSNILVFTIVGVSLVTVAERAQLWGKETS